MGITPDNLARNDAEIEDVTKGLGVAPKPAKIHGPAPIWACGLLANMWGCTAESIEEQITAEADVAKATTQLAACDKYDKENGAAESGYSCPPCMDYDADNTLQDDLAKKALCREEWRKKAAVEITDYKCYGRRTPSNEPAPCLLFLLHASPSYRQLISCPASGTAATGDANKYGGWTADETNANPRVFANIGDRYWNDGLGTCNPLTIAQNLDKDPPVATPCPDNPSNMRGGPGKRRRSNSGLAR